MYNIQAAEKKRQKENLQDNQRKKVTLHRAEQR